MLSSLNAVHQLGPILVGLPGTDLDSADRDLLRHPAVGGGVLVTRNFAGREQLLQLVREIRALRDSRLHVCIDQKRGRVQRLRDGFTRLPPLRALGRLHEENPRKARDLAYRHGRVMATEMLACGIDLSFSPVLDLDGGSCVIGDRSFSDRPEVVEELDRSYLGGMHDSGMKTTGKHFPGHGSVAADSHVDDVIDGRSLEQIEHSDLLPFQRLSDQLGRDPHDLTARVDPGAGSGQDLPGAGAAEHDAQGHQAYVVGGAVRDLCMGRPATDWDVTTSASPEQISSVFKDLRSFSLKHETVTLVHKGRHYEVTTFRGPKQTLEEDLEHRDFTINAMAYDIEKSLVIDPWGGRRDIEKKVVRGVVNPKDRFREDPLRAY